MGDSCCCDGWQAVLVLPIIRKADPTTGSEQKSIVLQYLAPKEDFPLCTLQHGLNINVDGKYVGVLQRIGYVLPDRHVVCELPVKYVTVDQWDAELAFYAKHGWFEPPAGAARAVQS